jgi:hypothetical protein
MPHTLASVDQNPFSRPRALPPSPRRRNLGLDFGGELAAKYQGFGPEDADIMFLTNVGICLQVTLLYVSCDIC